MIAGKPIIFIHHAANRLMLYQNLMLVILLIYIDYIFFIQLIMNTPLSLIILIQMKIKPMVWPILFSDLMNKVNNMEYINHCYNVTVTIAIISAIICVISFICVFIRTNKEYDFSALTHIFTAILVVSTRYSTDKSYIEWADNCGYEYISLRNYISNNPSIAKDIKFQKDVDEFNANVSNYNKICDKYKLIRVDYFSIPYELNKGGK